MSNATGPVGVGTQSALLIVPLKYRAPTVASLFAAVSTPTNRCIHAAATYAPAGAASPVGNRAT